ncbi:MAG TPA: hypothetical protein VGG16_19180 [Streptosporangiaceae bacterium]
MLAQMRALRGRARTDRHAYWFPLVLFGVLTCVSTPFYIRAQPAAGGTSSADVLPYFGTSSALVSHAAAYYWLGALLGGLVITHLWYRWHAQHTGLQTPSLPVVVITVALTAAAASIPLLSQHNIAHVQVLYPGDLTIRGTFPFVLIAVGLFALAWAERSRMLASITIIYAASALLASLYDISNLTQRMDWTPSPGDQALPNIALPALILLVAGAGAFVPQRPGRTTLSSARSPVA